MPSVKGFLYSRNAFDENGIYADCNADLNEFYSMNIGGERKSIKINRRTVRILEDDGNWVFIHIDIP